MGIFIVMVNMYVYPSQENTLLLLWLHIDHSRINIVFLR